MKCGSTYVSKLLSLYFGLDRRDPLPYWGRQEQNLDTVVKELLQNDDFVVQLHCRPHVPLIRWLTQTHVNIVFLWRNIADSLISLDDHIRNEDHRIPACYIQNPSTYSVLSPEQRYSFLIQHAGPWYVQLYLMWKHADATVPLIKGHYEQLASSPSVFFQRLIYSLAGEIDHERLSSLLSTKLENTRFNVGVPRRSLQHFTKLNRSQLEQLLHNHTENLSELLDELPWNGYGWREDVFQHRGAGVITDLLVSNELAGAPVGIVSETSPVTQTFCCRRPGLSRIELLGATYGTPVPSGILQIRLERGGCLVRQTQVPMSRIKDNDWIGVSFEPIPDSAGCDFELLITTAGVPNGCAFTLWSSDVNPHRRGTLRVAGELRGGTLCMRAACLNGADNAEESGTRTDVVVAV
jgi:hypothetical protein